MASKFATVVPLSRKLASSRLRRARVAAGLTQERAAQLVGVSSRSYGAWERGDVPLLALEALCILDALGSGHGAGVGSKPVPLGSIPSRPAEHFEPAQPAEATPMAGPSTRSSGGDPTELDSGGIGDLRRAA